MQAAIELYFAHALAAVPEINVQLRGGRIFPRQSVDVFFITAVDGGNDLSGIKVAHVDRTAAVDIALELADRSGRLKAGDDPEFARTKRLMDALPPRALRLALRAGALITQVLQRDIARLGLPFLALIPSVRSGRDRPSLYGHNDFAVAIRSLRTSIDLSTRQGGSFVLVTSAQRLVGKSTTACNLATALAYGCA